MPELSDTVTSVLAAYFQKAGTKVHKWVYPLTDHQFWHNPFLQGNDIGHLILHLTGNLNYYIGARIAGTGYVRDRDREFTERDRPTKDEVLASFDRAIALAAETSRKQSAADLAAAYSAERTTSENRFAILLDCAAHADHHAGQIILISRELSR